MSRVDHGVYAYARRTASTRGEHFCGHDADCGGPYTPSTISSGRSADLTTSCSSTVVSPVVAAQRGNP
ncbi:MAG: hypothetical protein R2710_26610 [Acidimicrobiales bacterium]